MSTKGPVDMMLREVSCTYNTPELRAAYRAGLSTAAIICDCVALRVQDDNPGRRKGSVSPVGEFGFSIARTCGDEIMAARKEISAYDDKD